MPVTGVVDDGRDAAAIALPYFPGPNWNITVSRMGVPDALLVLAAITGDTVILQRAVEGGADVNFMIPAWLHSTVATGGYKGGSDVHDVARQRGHLAITTALLQHSSFRPKAHLRVRRGRKKGKEGH